MRPWIHALAHVGVGCWLIYGGTLLEAQGWWWTGHALYLAGGLMWFGVWASEIDAAEGA